jgi:hypothetical protein
MKEMEDTEFQNCNEEAISRYNINDCLELFRKLQFLGLTGNGPQKKLVKSLELRIITLVIPNEAASSFTYKKKAGRP